MSLPSSSDQRQQVRVVGSNYTTFQYNGKPIAFLETVSDSGQSAFGGGSGQGWEPIHPLGYITPTDIVTGRVLQAGTVVLQIRELWHGEVWEQLQGLTGAKNIVDIFRKLAATPQYVTMTKIITPPDGKRYGKVYHRCVIVEIQDGEDISIGALSIRKGITVAYTHTTDL